MPVCYCMHLVHCALSRHSLQACMHAYPHNTIISTDVFVTFIIILFDAYLPSITIAKFITTLYNKYLKYSSKFLLSAWISIYVGFVNLSHQVLVANLSSTTNNAILTKGQYSSIGFNRLRPNLLLFTYAITVPVATTKM